MFDTITRKVGEIARYDVFRIVVFDSFKVSEFAFDCFGRSEEITDLNVKSIRTFVCNKVDFVIVGFTDFYVVTTDTKVQDIRYSRTTYYSRFRRSLLRSF